MTDLIKVASYVDRQDAELAKGILEENGINCFISSDDLAGLRPHLTLTGEGVSLVVAANDLLKAQEALQFLEIPTEDSQVEDEELERFKIKQNAKSFPFLLLITILEVVVGFWFLWHSLPLQGKAKEGIIFAGVAFLLLAAVGLIPCKNAYKARQKFNDLHR